MLAEGWFVFMGPTERLGKLIPDWVCWSWENKGPSNEVKAAERTSSPPGVNRSAVSVKKSRMSFWECGGFSGGRPRRATSSEWPFKRQVQERKTCRGHHKMCLIPGSEAPPRSLYGSPKAGKCHETWTDFMEELCLHFQGSTQRASPGPSRQGVLSRPLFGNARFFFSLFFFFLPPSTTSSLVSLAPLPLQTGELAFYRQTRGVAIKRDMFSQQQVFRSVCYKSMNSKKKKKLNLS